MQGCKTCRHCIDHLRKCGAKIHVAMAIQIFMAILIAQLLINQICHFLKAQDVCIFDSVY